MPNILCIQFRLSIDGNPFNREKALVASGEDFLLIDARVRNVISFCENCELILRMCYNYWVTGFQEVDKEKEGPIYSLSFSSTNCVNRKLVYFV